MLNRHESVTRTFAEGRTEDFQDFIDPVIRGKRQNLMYLDILLDLDLTVATANALGEDMWRACTNILIEDVAGPRWNMSGEGSRIMAGALCGWEKNGEHADSTTAANQSIELAMRIPFHKPHAHTPSDYEWSAEEFKRIRLSMLGDATLDVGSAAVTNNTGGTCRVTAWTRDVDEVHWGIRDEVTEVAMTSQTQHNLIGNGSFLAESFGYVVGGSGGADMANWVDHRLDKIIEPAWERVPDVLAYYRYERGFGNADVGTRTLLTDPFNAATNRAAWIVCPHRGYKLSDLPYIDTARKLTVGTGVASTILGLRQIYPKSGTTAAAYRKRYGLKEQDFHVATADGRNSAAGPWGELARFMPARASIVR